MTLYSDTSRTIASDRRREADDIAPLTDDEFRTRLATLVERSGRSRRQLSLAFGRDVGYVAALLDPARPSRARPTPDDIASASKALGIPFQELLELLWGISLDP
jgi:hypothetical protein